MNISYISHSPVNPLVSSLFLRHRHPEHSGSEPIPSRLAHSTAFAITCSKEDLAAASTIQQHDCRHQECPECGHSPVVLPGNYEFGDPTLRRTSPPQNLTFKERYSFRLTGPGIYAFNISNLTGYSYTLDTKVLPTAAVPNPIQTFAFGNHGSRLADLRSAGPRAFQIGAPLHVLTWRTHSCDALMASTSALVPTLGGQHEQV